MPNLTLKATRLTTKAKNLLLACPVKLHREPYTNSTCRRTVKLIGVTCYLLLVTLLSGCSAVGFSKPAALQVTSKPEASVFLDGKHIGKTPFYSDQLKPGEHTLKITVEAADYVDIVTLYEGTLTVVNRDLASNFLAQSGENLSLVAGKKGVFIMSIPIEADVTIDGKYEGKTPIVATNLKIGDHKIQIAKENYVERELTIQTSPKYQLVAEVTLASEIAKGNMTQEKPQQLKVDRALILNTPQGFLRVRSKPSLSAEEIGQASSGDEFEIIQETKEWFQISFEGKPGWISTAYAQKVE